MHQSFISTQEVFHTHALCLPLETLAIRHRVRSPPALGDVYFPQALVPFRLHLASAQNRTSLRHSSCSYYAARTACYTRRRNHLLRLRARAVCDRRTWRCCYWSRAAASCSLAHCSVHQRWDGRSGCSGTTGRQAGCRMNPSVATRRGQVERASRQPG